MRPHQKLIVWQEAIQLIKKIYSTTMKFPENEKFGLTSQLRRAAVSVACNIAEGAARSSKKEFIYFTHISSGSLSEVDTLLIVSKELNLIDETEFRLLVESNNKTTALLNGLIKRLKTN
jgi:four helix bundle protein